eukprot:5870752-Pyramimonas_sp.AAC.1
MGGDRGGGGGDFSRGPRWQCRHCGCKKNESDFQYSKHCKKWWNAPVESAPADDRTARGDPAALRRTTAGVAAGQAAAAPAATPAPVPPSKSDLEQLVQLCERTGNN